MPQGRIHKGRTGWNGASYNASQQLRRLPIEERIKKGGQKLHGKWKADMFRLQNQKVGNNDAMLVLNFDKGTEKNYIGGSVLLEMFKAWELGKKITYTTLYRTIC